MPLVRHKRWLAYTTASYPVTSLARSRTPSAFPRSSRWRSLSLPSSSPTPSPPSPSPFLAHTHTPRFPPPHAVSVSYIQPTIRLTLPLPCRPLLQSSPCSSHSADSFACFTYGAPSPPPLKVQAANSGTAAKHIAQRRILESNDVRRSRQATRQGTSALVP